LGCALTAHHTASNLPHVLQEKDADVGVAQRHVIERRGTNVRLGIQASLVCSNYRSNMYIYYRYYKCTIFVTTRKRIGITKHPNTQSKSRSNTDIRHEDDEM